MNGRHLDLGLVASVHVQSFGEPGQRTFRILAESGDGQVSIWLEKEQVVMLGNAIDELLERVPDESGQTPASTATENFRGDLEVKAASLSVAYEQMRDGFILEATDLYETPFELTGISLLAGRSQLLEMSEEISDIVAASRPRCLLCGRPLTPEGHFCPQSNGHTEITMPD